MTTRRRDESAMGSGSLAHLALFKFCWRCQGRPGFRTFHDSWAPAHWLTLPFFSFVGYGKAARPTRASKRFMGSGSGSMARLAWPCLSFVGYVKADQGSDSELS